MHTPTHFAELVADAVAGRVRPQVAARHDPAEIHAAQEESGRGEYGGKTVMWPTAL